MKKKLINFIFNILNFLKILITTIINFFFNLFNNDKKSIVLNLNKSNNTQKTDNISYNNSTTNTSGHNEDPNSKIINSNITFSITDITLEKIIIKLFCEELEIKEENLNKNEKEYIENLKEKLTPIIRSDLDKNTITNESNLTLKIKKLIVNELEYQFKLEQKKELPPEKLIITPIIIRKKEIENHISHKDIPLNKNTFLETKKNLVILDDKVNNTTHTPTFSPKETPNSVADIPENDKYSKEDNIETLSSTNFNIPEDLSNDYPEKTTSVHENSSTISESLKDYVPKTPPLDNITIENIPNEIVDETKKEDNKISLTETKLEKVIELTEVKEVNNEYQDYDYNRIDKYIQNTTSLFNQESKKEELEDKNYDILEKQIDALLNEINKLKLKKLSPSAKKKLLFQENKLLQLKDNLNFQKLKDIELEETNLEATIFNEDLKALEKELESLHLEDKLDLQNFYINNLEELDMMTLDKAKKIEKELIKLKLKKAIHALEIPSLLALPFIRNKYFMFFTGGLFVNRHLKFFDAILKRKSIPYEPEDLTQIQNGSDSFFNALLLSRQNIEYLETLEAESFRKYPELKEDIDYIIHLNILKTKLLKQQEKLLKKEAMLKKHNIKLNKRIRKLKKKENQSF